MISTLIGSIKKLLILCYENVGKESKFFEWDTLNLLKINHFQDIKNEERLREIKLKNRCLMQKRANIIVCTLIFIETMIVLWHYRWLDSQIWKSTAIRLEISFNLL